MQNYKEYALMLLQAGVHTIPINENKAPIISGWDCFKERQTPADIERIFQFDCYGIAMIVTKDIEVIDIDMKYDLTGNLFNRYLDYSESFGNIIAIEDTLIQTTTNKGFHLIYRSAKTEGNQKLARRPASKEEIEQYNAEVDRYNIAKSGNRKKIIRPEQKPSVLIETRGEGGYVAIYPTPGYTLGNHYDFTSIPEISPEQRQTLISSARAFNELHDVNERSEQDKTITTKPGNGLKSYEHYNRDVGDGEIIDMIENAGWSVLKEDSERVYFTRPGKDRGNSGDYSKKHRLFKSWSTSTEFEAEKAYTPFAVYSVLEHDGNFRQAAKVLYNEGWGTPEQYDPRQTAEEVQEEKDELEKYLDENTFDIKKRYQEEEAVLWFGDHYQKEKVAGQGMIVGVVGRQKSGKSFLTSWIVAACLANKPLTKVIFERTGDILYFDTEQPEFFWALTQRRIFEMAGKKDNQAFYKAVMMRPLSPVMRLKLIQKVIDDYKEKGKRIGAIIIDGIVDLCNNSNDIEESTKVIQRLMTWTDETKAVLFTILHVTKGEGFLRGHIGTKLQEKADVIIEVKVEDGIYNVSPRDCRFKEFTAFTFRRGDDAMGMPVVEGTSMYEGIEEEKRKQEILNNHKLGQITRPVMVDDEDLPF